MGPEYPGSRDDGTVDDEVLLAWIERHGNGPRETDRLERCDSMIGELLARHNHKEEDGSWPCIPIRDALEEVGTEDVFDGFAAGIFNKRGGHFKSLTEGGRTGADARTAISSMGRPCKIDWPNTALPSNVSPKIRGTGSAGGRQDSARSR